MPGTARVVEAGTVVHVLDRGHGRQRRFRKDTDFAPFERAPAESLEPHVADRLTHRLTSNPAHQARRSRMNANETEKS